MKKNKLEMISTVNIRRILKVYLGWTWRKLLQSVSKLIGNYNKI